MVGEYLPQANAKKLGEELEVLNVSAMDELEVLTHHVAVAKLLVHV